jgi:acetoin utilization protein AcuB
MEIKWNPVTGLSRKPEPNAAEERTLCSVIELFAHITRAPVVGEKEGVMHRIPIREIMKTELITIRPDQLVADAAQLLREFHIRRLPVVDADGYLVGIVTDSDVREAESADSLLNNYATVYAPVQEEEWLTIADIMTRDVITIHLDATVGELASKFVQHKVGGLPVVANQSPPGSPRRERPVGIVTETDIFAIIAAAWQAERAGH